MPEEQDAGVWFAGLNGELSEIGIVRYDDSPGRARVSKDHDIVASTQTFVLHGAYVLAAFPQAGNDVWMDVLVR
ncbi:MAG: hypothetical protein JWO36_6490 [Myxococcales bacterium]|nr:hypothetical protein [Myxococcales bacterium]